MEEKRIMITPFSIESDKLCMWSGKFLARSGWLEYHIILRVIVKFPTDNEEDKTKEDATLKTLNKKAYNDLILAQYDTVCSKIAEELVTK